MGQQNATIVVGIRFPVDLVKALDVVAEREQRTRAGQIIWILTNAVSGEQRNPGSNGVRPDVTVPVPVTVDTPRQAYETARALKPEPVLVAPTRDNLPGPKPKYAGRGKVKPEKEAAPIVGRRVLAEDAELYAAREAAMNRVAFTVEQQKEPDPERGYRECHHGRNLYRCEWTACKVLDRR